jgi:hypothetical protein
MQDNNPVIENVLNRLDGVQKTGSGWIARCPCRDDDHNPSLSVGEGREGQVLVTCFAGRCDINAICSAMGIGVTDLWPPKDGNFSFLNKPIVKRENSGQSGPTGDTRKKEKLRFIASYDYYDAGGELLFQKVKYMTESGKKTFRQRKPMANGEWSYSLEDTPRVLYNLPGVAAAIDRGEPVWLVEGEKDADTLISRGITATTMPNGAGSWLEIHTETLAGGIVEIIADNDEAGRAHATNVLKKLIDAGCSAQIWVSPHAKDITDHVEAGYSLDELEPMPGQENSEVAEQDMAGPEIEEEIPQEEIEEPKSRFDDALGKLSEVLTRDDLNPGQKITKASMIISGAAAEKSSITDPGRLIQWNDFVSEVVDDSYDWVIPGLIERGERVIVVAAEGVGKRATIDSVVPTPSGWTTLGDISVGDEVIDRFGNPVNVTYVSPIEPNPDAYRVTFSDGNHIDADAEHQWYTETVNEREKRKLGGVRTTVEIRDTLISCRQTKALNHAIPTTRPLNLPEAKLPIPPYTLGAWLGDGNTIDGSICSEDEEILEAIRDDGYIVRKRESTPNIYGILGLQVQLKEHGLYGNKHIPTVYSRASYEQRLALVQGLMDTDGYVRNDGLCEFSVNHKELAKGFLDLIQTLGIKTTMHESDSKLYGRVTGTRYRISFKTDLPVCRLKRKKERLPEKLSTQRSLYRYVVSVEPITSVPMRCISVDGPDNTYLIGDAYIPTHNTMLARQVAICSAAGIHPFTYARMKPVRTLTVDLENPERIIRRMSDSIVKQAMRLGNASRLYGEIYTKPSGMNLLKSEDRLLLEDAIERAKPEILVMGPLYKSFVDPGGRTSEAIAVEIAKYLDTIRTVYKCALWLEHHAPLGTTMTTRELRPFGSAVWSRWPEFGISLQPDPTANEPYVYDVRHFRGARDERNWPLKIKRGKQFPFVVTEYSKVNASEIRPMNNARYEEDSRNYGSGTDERREEQDSQ